ncbi:MAG: hypothetical protein KIY10_10155 [Thermoplasmata archaeon]|nr:hypothetical protein [Candidatus Sysuiplasma jiujiangense]MBX8642923.1 hypothetical protein [Candidatus Sysuiplasma jiujiangense]
MSVADLDPQILAAKEIVKGLKELKPVLNEILDQFGISKEDNFQGLIPLTVLLYPKAKELAVFLHNMIIIQGQVMKWLENAGADIQSAIQTVQNPVVLGPILPGGII